MAMQDEEEPHGREKIVVLVRHGIAEDPSPGKPDDQRSLTAEGHARMMTIARGLEKVFPRAQVIISSPLVRALQTALWVSKGYRSRIKIETSDALRPEGESAEVIELIESTPLRRIVLVGHEPSLTRSVLDLTGLRGGGAALAFKKGGACALRYRGAEGSSLEWLLPPRVLRKLGEDD